MQTSQRFVEHVLCIVMKSNATTGRVWPFRGMVFSHVDPIPTVETRQPTAPTTELTTFLVARECPSFGTVPATGLSHVGTRALNPTIEIYSIDQHSMVS